MPSSLAIFEFLGTTEMLVIAVVALIIFGPRKLPEIGRTVGKSLAEFKRASEDFKRTWEREVEIDRIESDLRADVAGAGAAPPALGAAAPGGGLAASGAAAAEEDSWAGRTIARSPGGSFEHTETGEAEPAPERDPGRVDDSAAEESTRKHDWL